jgi:hypothetical protein
MRVLTAHRGTVYVDLESEKKSIKVSSERVPFSRKQRLRICLIIPDRKSFYSNDYTDYSSNIPPFASHQNKSREV